jgi:hypothetical protein
MAESWFPPDETTPERALEILEDLRRFVRETGILPEGVWECFGREVFFASMGFVEEWAREVLTELKRRHAGTCDEAARTVDPVILVRNITARYLARIVTECCILHFSRGRSEPEAPGFEGLAGGADGPAA